MFYTLFHPSDDVHVGSFLGLNRDNVASVHLHTFILLLEATYFNILCLRNDKVGARNVRFQLDTGILSAMFIV